MAFDEDGDAWGEPGEAWEDFEEQDKPTGKQRKKKIARIVLSDSVKPLGGKPRSQRFGTFDLETWRWEKPYLASYYSGKGEPVTFQSEPEGAPWLNGRDPGRGCVAQFLDFYLQKERAGTICYAHNGGKFDFLFVLWEMVQGRGFFERGFRWTIMPLQSGIFRLMITHPRSNKPWIFSDSVRLLPMPLDKVGESFGVGRKTDLRHELGLPPLPPNATRKQILAGNSRVFEELARPKNRSIAVKYNKMDCVILYDGLKKYEEQIVKIGGQMRATTPSSSIDVFRRRYQRREIFTNKHLATCPELGQLAKACRGCGHEAIRRAFAGGRTEIYTMFAKDLFYYDYNSHYLACMAERMPAEIATVIDGGNEEQVWKSMRSQGIGIIDCDVWIPEDCYLPPLPHKERVGGTSAKLLFPVGSFSGSWDTQELRLLPLVGGRITKVRQQLWFGASDIFSDFVAAIWEYRRTGATSAIRELAKLLGNANFGKWAQRPEAVEYFMDPTMAEVMRRKLAPYAGLEKMGVFVGDSEVEPKHIAPQLSVHICAVARERLWRTNWGILAAGGQLVYSDTDSTMVTGYYQDDSTELGGMKLEHHMSRADFRLPKTYKFQCFDDCPKPACKTDGGAHKIKAKGMGRGLGSALDLDEYNRIISTTIPEEQRKVRRQRISQFKEGCRSYARSGKRFPHVIDQDKGITGTYDKRRICADGVTTMPRIFRDNIPVF